MQLAASRTRSGQEMRAASGRDRRVHAVPSRETTIGYLRVSPDEQPPGSGLDVQRATIQEFASRERLRVAAFFEVAARRAEPDDESATVETTAMPEPAEAAATERRDEVPIELAAEGPSPTVERVGHEPYHGWTAGHMV